MYWLQPQNDTGVCTAVRRRKNEQGQDQRGLRTPPVVASVPPIASNMQLLVMEMKWQKWERILMRKVEKRLSQQKHCRKVRPGFFRYTQ